ncbi:MAG: hypothetical protein Edafosvirus3_32 [Edafosvirus sp.]|uniref:Uncharacterized protein n=1 Tax=Edafosvirus sp. TaxID=2487765 RepID=A0A3G4ZUG4_9VIRU|nr:MAG: hypothetical protein Edafosvirus3_32 [Edafosvirus sp.]
MALRQLSKNIFSSVKRMGNMRHMHNIAFGQPLTEFKSYEWGASSHYDDEGREYDRGHNYLLNPTKTDCKFTFANPYNRVWYRNHPEKSAQAPDETPKPVIIINA